MFTVGGAAVTPLSAWGDRTPATSRAANGTFGYTFFNAAEARFIEPACERLIPADGTLPGALDAGVPHYLDRQLGGPWGKGERPHRDGPWQPGSAAGGARSLHPAAVFRSSLHAIRGELYRRGTAFHALCPTAQHEFLVALQSRGAAAHFFDMLLTMTVEGFFAHPLHGKTRDRVAWRLVGFPGAYACAGRRS